MAEYPGTMLTPEQMSQAVRGIKQTQAGASEAWRRAFSPTAAEQSEAIGGVARAGGYRPKVTAATIATPNLAATTPTPTAKPASGAETGPSWEAPDVPDLGPSGETKMDLIRAHNEAAPRVMLSDDPLAVLAGMGGGGGGGDPLVGPMPEAAGEGMGYARSFEDRQSGSPFVGLGAADRERLQTALGGVNERYLQNMADIEAMEAIRDPRRREISEAQIEDALRLAERLPMERDLEEQGIQRKLAEGQDYDPNAPLPQLAGAELEGRPAQRMHDMTMQFAESMQAELDQFDLELNQDPGSVTQEDIARANLIRAMLGQLFTGGTQWGGLTGAVDLETMMATIAQREAPGAGGVNQGQGTVPQ